MSSEAERAVRGFFEAIVIGGSPSTKDYAEAGFDSSPEVLLLARAHAQMVAKATRPSPGSHYGQAGAKAVEQATADMLDLLGETWEPPPIDTTDLVDTIKRRSW